MLIHTAFLFPLRIPFYSPSLSLTHSLPFVILASKQNTRCYRATAACVQVEQEKIIHKYAQAHTHIHICLNGREADTNG